MPRTRDGRNRFILRRTRIQCVRLAISAGAIKMSTKTSTARITQSIGRVFINARISVSATIASMIPMRSVECFLRIAPT
jgi:hypothetical protein